MQSVNGVLSYFVWDEILPSQTTEQVRFNVNPGDSIVAKIAEVSGSTWSIYVDDLSSGQVDSQTETYSGSGSQASAEYIQEAPSVNGNVVPMDPFQPVTFLGSEINGGSAGLNSLQEVAIPGQSVPSSPNYYNDAFQVQYGGNTPAAPIPFESAMQANTNNLFTAGTAGTTNWTQGVMPGTSPSIANLPDGGYVAAFQSNNDQLLIAGTNGITNTGQGMQAGSSPSIVALPTGGYEIAFQANTDTLIAYGSAGYVSTNLGMVPSTSPSIAASPQGGYEIAFHATTGTLFTYSSSSGPANTNQGMASGTSPSIAALPASGYEIAFQANTDTLIAYGSAGYVSTNLGMASTTTPSIVALT